MTATVADLEIKFRSDTAGAGRDIASLDRQVQGAGRSMQNAFSTAGGFVVGAGITNLIGGFGDLVKGGFEFERQMANVNSIAQLTDSELAAVSKTVNALAGETAQAPQVLAQGLYNIYSSGFKGAEAIQILDASARAATAGLTSTDVAARAVTSVMNAYGEGVYEAGQVSDILFQTVNDGVITFEQLANNLGNTLPLANALGVSFEELAAAYAQMTLKGVSGAQAETQIRNLMQAAVNPTDALTAAVSDYGFATVQAFIQAKGLPGLLKLLNQETKGDTKALGDLLGNQEAVNAALILGAGDASAYTAEVKKMESAHGATQKALDKQMQSASMRMQQAKIAVQQAATAFIGALAPAVALTAQGFTYLVLNGLVPMVDAFSDVVAGGARFTGFLKDAFTSGKSVERLLGDLFGDDSDFVIGIGPGGPLDQASGRLLEFTRSLLTIADSIGDVVSAFRSGGLSEAASVFREEISNIGDELVNIAQIGLEALMIPVNVAFDTAVTIAGWLWEHRGAIWEGIKDLIGWGASTFIEAISLTIEGAVALGGEIADLGHDLWGWVLKELGFGGVTNAPGNSGSMSLKRDIPLGEVAVTGALVLAGGLAAVAGDVWTWVQNEILGGPSTFPGGAGMGTPASGTAMHDQKIDVGQITVSISSWLIEQATALPGEVAAFVLDAWNAAKATALVLGDYAIQISSWLISEAQALAPAVVDFVLNAWNVVREVGVSVGDFVVRIVSWLVSEATALAGAVADLALRAWNAASAVGITVGDYALRISSWLVSEGGSLAVAVIDQLVSWWPAIAAAGAQFGDFVVKLGGWIVQEVSSGDLVSKAKTWIDDTLNSAGIDVTLHNWTLGVSLPGDVAFTVPLSSILDKFWTFVSDPTSGITFDPGTEMRAHDLGRRLGLGLSQAIVAGISAIFGGGGGGGTGMGGPATQPRVEWTTVLGQFFSGFFEGFFATADEIVTGWENDLKAWSAGINARMNAAIGGVLTGLVEAITNAVTNPLAAVKDVVNPFGGGGGGGADAGPFSGIVDSLSDAVDGLITNIGSLFTELPGRVLAALPTLTFDIKPPELPSWLKADWSWITGPIQLAETIIPQFFVALASLVIPRPTLTADPPQLPSWLREWDWITGPVNLARTIIPQFFAALASLVIPRPVLTADAPQLPGWLREWGWITGPVQLAETIIPQFFNALAGVVAAAVPTIKIDIPHPELPSWMSTDLGWLTGPIDTLIGSITGQIGRLTGAFDDLAAAAKGPGGGALPSDVFGGETGAGKQPRLIADLSVDISAPAPGGMLLPPIEPIVVPISADTSAFAKGYHDAFGWGTVLAAQTFTSILDADNGAFSIAYTEAFGWGQTLAGQTFRATLDADDGLFAIAYTEAFGWGETFASQTFSASLAGDAGAFATAYTAAYGWGETFAAASFTATLNGDPGPFGTAYSLAFGWGDVFAGTTFTATLDGDTGPFAIAYTSVFTWGRAFDAAVFVASLSGETSGMAAAVASATAMGNAFASQSFTATLTTVSTSVATPAPTPGPMPLAATSLAAPTIAAATMPAPDTSAALGAIADVQAAMDALGATPVVVTISADASGFTSAASDALALGAALSATTFSAQLSADPAAFATAYTSAFGWGQTLAGQTFTARLAGDPGLFAIAYTTAFGWGNTFAAQTFTATLAGDNGPAAIAYTEAFGWGQTWAAQTFTAQFSGDAGGASTAFSQAMGYGNAWAGNVFTARFAVDTSGITNAVSVAQNAAAQIAALLPHSPAETGPLSRPISFAYIADDLAAQLSRMGPDAERSMSTLADQLRRPLGVSVATNAALGVGVASDARSGASSTVHIGGPTIQINAPVYGVEDLATTIVDVYTDHVIPAQEEALRRRDRALGLTP